MSTANLSQKLREHLDFIEQVSHAPDSKKFKDLWPELDYLR